MKALPGSKIFLDLSLTFSCSSLLLLQDVPTRAIANLGEMEECRIRKCAKLARCHLEARCHTFHAVYTSLRR